MGPKTKQSLLFVIPIPLCQFSFFLVSTPSLYLALHFPVHVTSQRSQHSVDALPLTLKPVVSLCLLQPKGQVPSTVDLSIKGWW